MKSHLFCAYFHANKNAKLQGNFKSVVVGTKMLCSIGAQPTGCGNSWVAMLSILTKKKDCKRTGNITVFEEILNSNPCVCGQNHYGALSWQTCQRTQF
jgi:hypothetical protein